MERIALGVEPMKALGVGAVWALAGGRWHLLQTGRCAWPRPEGQRFTAFAPIDAYRLVAGDGTVIAEDDRR